jgi:hypothetical protein
MITAGTAPAIRIVVAPVQLQKGLPLGGWPAHIMVMLVGPIASAVEPR